MADLKTLVSAQEGVFSQVTVRYRSANGWSATATNPSLQIRPDRCGIFIGPASYSPNRAVTGEGIPACW